MDSCKRKYDEGRIHGVCSSEQQTKIHKDNNKRPIGSWCLSGDSKIRKWVWKAENWLWKWDGTSKAA